MRYTIQVYLDVEADTPGDAILRGISLFTNPDMEDVMVRNGCTRWEVDVDPELVEDLSEGNNGPCYRKKYPASASAGFYEDQE